MENDHPDKLAGGGGARESSDTTERTDLPSLFAINLGLALREGGRRVVENGDAVLSLGSKLGTDSRIRRRAGLAGLHVELATTKKFLVGLLETVEDADTMVQDYAHTITMELSRK